MIKNLGISKVISHHNLVLVGLAAKNEATIFAHVEKQNTLVAKPAEYAMKAPPDNPNKTVAFPIKNGYRIVRCDDIVRCEAAGNYTTVVLANGQEFSLCKRLKEVEAMLPGAVFCRVHQSHLVNLGWVEMWVRGTVEGLVLTDETTIPVSRSKKNELKRLLQAK